MKTLFKILFVTLISCLPMILTAQPVGALSVETIYGEVTIGALNPYSNIHFIADTDTKNFFFNKPIWTSGGEIGSYADDLRLKTHNDTRMTILRNNGYVGIGITAPKRNLDVRGAIRATGNPNNYLEIAHGGTNSFINHGGVGRMDFRFAGIGKMSLKSDGKLVVGNVNMSTPGDYKLYVEKAYLPSE